MTKLNKELLVQLMDSCFSIREILECAGYSRCSGNNYNTFHKCIQNYGLQKEYEFFKLKRQEHFIPASRLSNEELFVLGSCFRGTRMRKRILEDKLKPYCCDNSDCPTRALDSWRGKELIFELDHINGSNRDNRLDNLRFLCLYCHRQTETYGNKNNVTYELTVPKGIKHKKIAPQYFCLECNVEVTKKAKRCAPCSLLFLPKKFTPSKEELLELVQKYPMTVIGEMFGVTDNSVRKRLKKFGIKLEGMRGYWQKVAANKIII